MAKLKVQYNPKHKQMVYTIWFNPSIFDVEESSNFKESFEGCLDFVLQQFIERANLSPNMQRFNLEIKGTLPKTQRVILERIVELYNRSPRLYEIVAEFKIPQDLPEDF